MGRALAQQRHDRAPAASSPQHDPLRHPACTGSSSVSSASSVAIEDGPAGDRSRRPVVTRNARLALAPFGIWSGWYATCGDYACASPSKRYRRPVAPPRRAGRHFGRWRRTPAATSVGDRLITRRISPVAVCCSSASVKVAVARLELLEQPHVLDGDDGLIGEGLEERDLGLREGPRRVAIDDDRADGAPSRSIGTASMARKPPARATCCAYSGSVSTSSTWTTPRQDARPAIIRGPAASGTPVGAPGSTSGV